MKMSMKAVLIIAALARTEAGSHVVATEGTIVCEASPIDKFYIEAATVNTLADRLGVTGTGQFDAVIPGGAGSPSYGYQCKDWAGDANNNGIRDCYASQDQINIADGYTAGELIQIRAACPASCTEGEQGPIVAVATESRRLEGGMMDSMLSVLREKMGYPRRLAGKWSIAVTITVATADDEAMKATAKLLQNDPVRQLLYTDVMRPMILKVGGYVGADLSAAAASFSVTSVDFVGINTVAEDEAAAAAAAAAEEAAADGANALSCNFALLLAVFALAFGITKQTA